MNNGFVPLEERIKELVGKGLIIDDEVEAKNFLLHIGYEHLRGYIEAFMDNGAFALGASFVAIKEAYLFDQELRHILLFHLETSLKAIYCHEFCQEYGDTEYLDHSLFVDPIKHQEILDKVDIQRKRRALHDPAYGYFGADGTKIDLPLNLYVELFTIKDITDLYILSEIRIKRAAALSLGLTFKRREITLGRIMRGLTNLRNLCAHGKRIYGFDELPSPCLSKKEENFLPKMKNKKPSNYRLFGYFFVFRKLLPQNDFRILKYSLSMLAKKYPSVDMKHYGFPHGWQRLL